MAAYNLCCLTKTDRFETAYVIDADIDDAAIAEAQTIATTLNRQLWQNGRLIAVIAADPMGR